MKTLYFDCIAGASGDMILGALIDAGLSLDLLKEKLNLLNLDEFDITVKQVKKNGFAATKLDVLVKDEKHERHFSDIKHLVEQSDLSDRIKEKASQIFWELCEKEAKIHNSSPEKVHLHELGGVDTIVDVVGTLIGLELLNVDNIVCSPLPMGRGFVKGAHGKIPLPAPATAALLKNIPVYGVDVNFELVTPTGAVLLKTLATEFGVMPAMQVSNIGYGAGNKDLDIPNVIRVFIGEEEKNKDVIKEHLAILETNIDDQNPEFFDHIMTLLFEKGALDVWMDSIQMKKNRPAIKLSVLCKPNNVSEMKRIIFTESNSIGLREALIMRHSLPRKIIKVETKYGPVNVKIAHFEGNKKVIPEYEDCKLLSRKNGVSITDTFHQAILVASGLIK
ncbi:MAG: nickel pincer cofactor biosynthesis protein LarC [Bacteroidales bacterium]|nr:nickel pincer cofactor biosynthesis protein LarC [Bacteroidales bacterium]MCF8405155.1 nickel pincer cofactor biosynthesis protein LarC [Bacteroidales bacterium]